MGRKIFTAIGVALALSACSTGNGGTVLPSPIGDAAVSRACRNAPPDLIPAPPVLANSVWMGEGRGSSADALEILRMGFARVTFDVTAENLNQGGALSPTDTLRWSQVPLTTKAGPVTLEVAPRGDPRCVAFEREVEAQRNSTDPKANTDDPMKYWTDTRYPAAPPEGRNWCIATMASPELDIFRFTRTVTNSDEGHGNISVTTEIIAATIEQATGNLVAQRTLVRLYRPSFPIGVSSVATGCDGRTIGPTPEFFGPNGIAFRPLNPPTLINK